MTGSMGAISAVEGVVSAPAVEKETAEWGAALSFGIAMYASLRTAPANVAKLRAVRARTKRRVAA